jgi:mRNA-degrading endonuclease RelE of RelBE toxin-antitoxin system
MRISIFFRPLPKPRIGPHRFFYEVDEEKKIVFMIAAETRQGSY